MTKTRISRIYFWGIGLALMAVAGRFLPPWELAASQPKPVVRVFDRQGQTLRALAGKRGAWVPLAEISPWVVKATVLAEDQRFFSHQGLDALACARALAVNLRAGRVVAGGSTLTQQLARQRLGHRRRDLGNKLGEAVTALYLEWRMSKPEILEDYFSRAPYGNECYGVYAASLKYFNRPPSNLSLAQAALLSVIPRNPNHYNPYRHLDRVLRQQKKLLARLRASGTISPAEYTGALAEPMVFHSQDRLPAANHFCDWLLSRPENQGRDLHTTLDLELNTALEQLTGTYIAKLGSSGITNAAVVVLDNRACGVLAMVGSADYWNPNISGAVNGAVALRQPGSAIKPFTYALALERGLPPSYLLPDVATHFSTRRGDYFPHNYDEQFHGPTRLRTALGCSYNVPAVKVLEDLGEANLLARLRQAGFSHFNRPADNYGPGLTLGNAEVTLLELTRGYAALAHQGLYRDERVLLDGPGPVGTRIFSPEAAFLTAHILSDASARAPAFGEASPIGLPFPCAVKTGTTKNYKDNWAVGFTRDYTVGVWVGNFNGDPMHGVSGVSGAGPLFRDVMLTLHRDRRPENFLPVDNLVTRVICPLSGDLAQAHCPETMQEYFISGHAPTALCAFHQGQNRLVYPEPYRDWVLGRNPDSGIRWANQAAFQVDYPDSGDVFKLDPGLRPEFQKLRFRAVVPEQVRDLIWYLDGQPVGRGLSPEWRLSPGAHELYAQGKSRGVLTKTPAVQFKVLR